VGKATPVIAVPGFVESGKALAQVYLGVAVLKTETRICGEAGFAKHCNRTSSIHSFLPDDLHFR
jgi:hypothetical protein